MCFEADVRSRYDTREVWRLSKGSSTHDVCNSLSETIQIDISFSRSLRPHPNVIQIFGVCNQPVCILTEYMKRGSLDVVMKTPQPFNNNRIVSIGKDIASGMHHLHLEVTPPSLHVIG